MKKVVFFILVVVSCFKCGAQCQEGTVICQYGLLYQCINGVFTVIGGPCGESANKTTITNSSLKMTNDTVMNFKTSEKIYLYDVKSASEIGLNNSTDKNMTVFIRWDNASDLKSYKVNSNSSIKIKMEGKEAAIVESKVAN
jgi:hypothetical protein